MKISCEVINDLLPLYHDEVCSEESKRIVEEHLKECENCREIAKKIGGEFHVPQKELDDATFFKNIQQEYKIKNIVFSILLICLVGIGSHLARNYQFMPVGASSFQISEVSQLEDKTIGFYMKICDGKDVRFITAKRANEEGIVYIHGKRALMEEAIDNSIGYHEQYFYYNAEEYNQWLSGLDQSANEDLQYITEVRFGTEEDYVLLWKTGMDLPEASERMKLDYTDADK